MKPTTKKTARHHELGLKIDHDGGAFGERLAMEAAAHNVPLSVLCGVCEQESGFKNVFGHDKKATGGTSGIPARWAGTIVTKWKYRWYKMSRKLGNGNQGVGPFQLTNPSFQDEADADGGCWRTDVSIATAASILSDSFRHNHDWRKVYAIWNAGSENTKGRLYANSVYVRQQKWHKRLGSI